MAGEPGVGSRLTHASSRREAAKSSQSDCTNRANTASFQTVSFGFALFTVGANESDVISRLTRYSEERSYLRSPIGR
jgi:hypothetical protein